MSKARKSLCLVLVLCFALTAALTGCNKANVDEPATDGGTTTSAEATPAVTEATPEPALEPVELSWYTIGNPQPDTAKVVAEANKTLKEKLNVTLKFEIFDYNSYGDKLSMMMMSGEEFDLCFTSNWSNNYVNNATAGYYVAVDELLEKYGPAIKEQIPEKFFEPLKIGGKTYGILNYQYLGQSEGVWFKKDLVEKYNLQDAIDKIQYVEDLTPIFDIIKQNMKEDGIQYVLSDTVNGHVKGEVASIETVSQHAGVYYNDPDLKVVNVIETPGNILRYKIVRDWNQKGYITQDALAITDWMPIIKSGTVFAGYEPNVKPGVEGDRSNKNGFECVVKATTEPIMSYGTIQATVTSISLTSKNPERAMMLLNLMHEDKDLFNLLAYGIKDEHYILDAEGKVEFVKDSKYNHGSDWAIANSCNLMVKTGQDDNVWQVSQEMNNAAVRTPLFGFNFNTEPVTGILTQIDTVNRTYGGALKYGMVDVDETLARWNKEAKAAGLDDLLAEAQKQIDVWKATK